MAVSERDTDGDALAAQVRRIPALQPDRVAALLARARGRGGDPERRELIEGHLGIALDAALARPTGGLTIDEAFQEASVAIVAAATEYVHGSGDPAGLRHHLEVAARDHLVAESRRRDRERRDDERLARDAEALEAALFAIRRRTGRPATSAEAAESLEWPLERVRVVSEAIAVARSRYDEEISAYVDDEG
jgi:hypothetical protein